MKANLFSLFVLLLCITFVSSATKLVDVKLVDRDYLMVYFKDSEVFYKDDGLGQNAYINFSAGPESDSLKSFGHELDVDIAVTLTSWTIYSEKDTKYGTEGKHPVSVFRKSKPNNTDHAWNYKLDHWIFLKLPHPLKEGMDYTLTIAPETFTDVAAKSFRFNNFESFSEAIHVNIIGYTPESPVKSADLYLWLGDGGQRDYSSFEGNSVWLYNIGTGEKFIVGQVSFWKSKDTDTEAEGRNLTGSDVWNVDFSHFSKPGEYRLVVNGVGCSMPFKISHDVFYSPFKTSVRGYYYMRIGEDRMDLNPVPRRPLYIPGKDPEGFTIYVTDLDPFDPEWRARRGDTWDEPHWKPARQSIFWKRRLPGNPTNQIAQGGHSDALDWDRHLAHVSNIYDMLLPFVLTYGRLNEDNLDIAESGNGIPDILDEARNEVDFWLSLRHGDAYAHGLTNPTTENTIMFQAGTTTMAAWANAANCAMMAECFRLSKMDKLKKYYTKEAVQAFTFAEKQVNQQLDDRQDIGDVIMRGRDFKMMAAAFLYNLTGNTKWEDIMAQESVIKTGEEEVVKRRQWYQTWGTAAYLFCPQERHFPALYENMKSAVRKQAHEHNVKYMSIRPSRRSSNNNRWQTAQNMDLVILAHAISDNPDEKIQLLSSMVLEADWGLGRNPTNTVEMTGLGERYIVSCYTSGGNDGTPGMHPGHTPYNNLDPWGNSNEANPRWFTQRCFPEWFTGGWPYQEGFFNCRYSYANAEFTPRQTMRGKMALYGYLYGIR